MYYEDAKKITVKEFLFELDELFKISPSTKTMLFAVDNCLLYYVPAIKKRTFVFQTDSPSGLGITINGTFYVNPRYENIVPYTVQDVYNLFKTEMDADKFGLIEDSWVRFGSSGQSTSCRGGMINPSTGLKFTVKENVLSCNIL